MILLDDVEMANIIFLTIQQHKAGENKIVTDLIKTSLKKVQEKDIQDTQDICDTVIECFDFYNDFVNEKNMNLPLIQESSYDMIVALLNNIIGEMINAD